MDLILPFIDVPRKIALIFAVVIFLPDIITREMRLTKRLLPIFIGTLSIMLSGTILKHMLISERFEATESQAEAVVAQSTVESVLSGNDDTERQEITVEWYSDEDDSQDLAKMIALIIGIVLATVIVIFVIYILKEKNKNKLEFLKTCNLSDLSQEELEKYLKWLFCNRKSFSVFLAEAIFADSGKINPEIYELEEKIEKELERRK